MAPLATDGFSQADLKKLLEQMADTRVAIFGDFGLDVYLFTDLSASENSLESGLPTQPVRRHVVELGAAGNVAKNVAAIGCRDCRAFGVVGPDVWGHELERLLVQRGVRTDNLVCQDAGWATPAYMKPYEDDQERGRFDFGVFNALDDDVADRLLDALAEQLPELDVVIVNQQMVRGVHSDYLRPKLAALIAAHPETPFVIDSRHFADAYPHAYAKVNDHEAARQIGRDYPLDALVLKVDADRAGQTLHDRLAGTVFVTRADRGLIVCDNDGVREVPGIQIVGPVDTVGAGDACLAGIGLALAAGASTDIAATFGNLAAAITVRKLRQTGTATPAELLAQGAVPDYVYRPELADDPRHATLVPGTEFETIGDRQPPRRITHAIFDHDGTLSTLRQGWEAIMEPLMIRAILGPVHDTADESLFCRVADRVRTYIDQSTGVQTLRQMQVLAEMVREFGVVPVDEILDEHGYKRLYDAELLAVVRRRIGKFERGELAVEDFTVKNAVALLHRLVDAGVELYLASGTDEQDVIDEATALGYADLFEGRIYGSSGDVTHDAKRMVLDRILGEIDSASGLVTFGDGPVEIRETHKRGGYTVGVASDERRRFGLENSKRRRLVRAGADLIVPDFSQLPQLMAFVGL